MINSAYSCCTNTEGNKQLVHIGETITEVELDRCSRRLKRGNIIADILQPVHFWQRNHLFPDETRL